MLVSAIEQVPCGQCAASGLGPSQQHHVHDRRLFEFCASHPPYGVKWLIAGFPAIEISAAGLTPAIGGNQDRELGDISCQCRVFVGLAICNHHEKSPCVSTRANSMLFKTGDKKGDETLNCPETHMNTSCLAEQASLESDSIVLSRKLVCLSNQRVTAITIH